MNNFRQMLYECTVHVNIPRRCLLSFSRVFFLCQWINEWTNEWMNAWMNACTHERTNERTNECTVFTNKSTEIKKSILCIYFLHWCGPQSMNVYFSPQLHQTLTDLNIFHTVLTRRKFPTIYMLSHIAMHGFLPICTQCTNLKDCD